MPNFAADSRQAEISGQAEKGIRLKIIMKFSRDPNFFTMVIQKRFQGTILGDYHSIQSRTLCDYLIGRLAGVVAPLRWIHLGRGGLSNTK